MVIGKAALGEIRRSDQKRNGVSVFEPVHLGVKGAGIHAYAHKNVDPVLSLQRKELLQHLRLALARIQTDNESSLHAILQSLDNELLKRPETRPLRKGDRTIKALRALEQFPDQPLMVLPRA